LYALQVLWIQKDPGSQTSPLVEAHLLKGELTSLDGR
jgi:hypothetical protein